MNISALAEALKRGSNLHNFRTLQFLAEFLFFSKFGEESPVFQEFLIATEMVKFLLKLVDFHRAYRGPLPSNLLRERPGDSNVASPPSRLPSRLGRLSAALGRIKAGEWSRADHQSEIFEVQTSGKRVQLVSSVEVGELGRKRARGRQLAGELLLMLRPLLAVVAIRVFGEDSWKPYLLSLAVELLGVWLQRGLTVLDNAEVGEWESRQRDLVWRCLFKRPFYDLFRDRLIKPALGTVLNEAGLIHRLLMYVLEIQSSITLTI